MMKRNRSSREDFAVFVVRSGSELTGGAGDAGLQNAVSMQLKSAVEVAGENAP
jgi:hypothetical protein